MMRIRAGTASTAFTRTWPGTGYRVSPKRVRRLARAAGLACVHPLRYKATTVQDPANACGLVDLVGRDFVPGAKDQLWYGDITYIFTMSGWAYLATVIDGYSRKVVGWSVADHMREELVIDAFRMAVANRLFCTGEVVFHSALRKPVHRPRVP